MLSSQTGITAVISCAAVREAGVSRYHRGTIEDPLKPTRTSRDYMIHKGFWEALNWVTIMWIIPVCWVSVELLKKYRSGKKWPPSSGRVFRKWHNILTVYLINTNWSLVRCSNHSCVSIYYIPNSNEHSREQKMAGMSVLEHPHQAHREYLAVISELHMS